MKSIDNPEDYIPERFDEGHFKFLVKTEVCETCGVSMVEDFGKFSHFFPRYFRTNFDSQRKRAGLKIKKEIHEQLVCKDCANSSKVKFECSLCSKTKESNKLQEEFGLYNKDYLCKDCYENISAKIWLEKVEELEEDHRWDYH